MEKTRAGGTLEKGCQLGTEREKTHRGCSQWVIAALEDPLEVCNQAVSQADTGPAGGTGLTRDRGYGAYREAVLFLGSIPGRERRNFSGPEGVRFKTHKRVRTLGDSFTRAYGSVVCRGIQNRVLGRHDSLPDPREFEKFHDAGARHIHWPGGTGKAARWMAGIVLREGLLSR